MSDGTLSWATNTLDLVQLIIRKQNRKVTTVDVVTIRKGTGS